MKILFWAEPHFALTQPTVMETWILWFDNIGTSLARAAPDCEFRIVAFGPVSAERNRIYGRRLIELDQQDLRAGGTLNGEVFALLENDLHTLRTEKMLGDMLRARLDGFQPTHVVLLHEQPWLRRLLPQATFVNIELAWISRAPFPQFWHLDTHGSGKGRVLAEHPGLLQELDRENEWAAIAEGYAMQVRSRLADPHAQDFTQKLRQHYDNLCLLPLGIFKSYDGRTTLCEILDHFFETCPGDMAYLLTQHPIKPVLDTGELRYLNAKYPNVIDGSRHPSQALILLVDSVVGDFSTIAVQALFGATKVISIAHALPGIPPATPLLNPLAPLLARASMEERRSILQWMLSRYVLSERQIFDGKWLHHFLSKADADPATVYRDVLQAGRTWNEPAWRGAADTAPAPVREIAVDRGKTAEALLSHADKLHENHDSAAAADLAARLIQESRATMVAASIRQVWYCIRAGRFNDGMSANDFLLSLEDKADYHWQRSHLLESVGRHSEAIGAARGAVVRAPMNTRFRTHLVTLLLNSNQLDNAERHILIAYQQCPDDPVVLHRLSLLRSHQTRLEEACEAARKAAERAPENPDFARHLSNLETRLAALAQ